MEKFVVVGTKTKADHTPEQIKKWVAEYAQQEMAKAGDLEDLRVKETDVGDFKQANVSLF
jgi:hypothetical protein